MSVELIFSHPNISEDLVVYTGADQIGWTYNLVTQRFPTYGGEVVQILSCNIQNLNIQGTCAAYTTGDFQNPGVEEIYTWFLMYAQIASQGGYGTAAYVEEPILMQYPARLWGVWFQAQTMPGFNLSRDLVAPTWQITGKVVDASTPMKNFTLDNVLAGNTAAEFTAMHAGIDLSQPDPAINPFQSPFKGANEKVQSQQISAAIGNLGSYWKNLVSAWSNGEFASLDQTGSVGAANASLLAPTSAQITAAQKASIVNHGG